MALRGRCLIQSWKTTNTFSFRQCGNIEWEMTWVSWNRRRVIRERERATGNDLKWVNLKTKNKNKNKEKSTSRIKWITTWRHFSRVLMFRTRSFLSSANDEPYVIYVNSQCTWGGWVDENKWWQEPNKKTEICHKPSWGATGSIMIPHKRSSKYQTLHDYDWGGTQKCDQATTRLLGSNAFALGFLILRCFQGPLYSLDRRSLCELIMSRYSRTRHPTEPNSPTLLIPIPLLFHPPPHIILPLFTPQKHLIHAMIYCWDPHELTTPRIL